MLPALTLNIRLGWKWLNVIDTCRGIFCKFVIYGNFLKKELWILGAVILQNILSFVRQNLNQ
jgi:hypothetical protein